MDLFESAGIKKIERFWCPSKAIPLTTLKHCETCMYKNLDIESKMDNGVNVACKRKDEKRKKK